MWRTHNEVVDGVVHVWPTLDTREHETDGDACWCDPDFEVYPNARFLVSHRDELDRLALA